MHLDSQHFRFRRTFPPDFETQPQSGGKLIQVSLLRTLFTCSGVCNGHEGATEASGAWVVTRSVQALRDSVFFRQYADTVDFLQMKFSMNSLNTLLLYFAGFDRIKNNLFFCINL